MRVKRRGDTRGEAQATLSVRVLSPGYFAFVMATGIISVGAQQRGFAALAQGLLVVAIVGYVLLIGLNIWRLTSCRAEMMRDFINPSRAFGFFTFIAATNVIAAALVSQGWVLSACILLAISALAWLVLGYAIPWAVLLKSRKTPVLAHVNGSWFIWAVASQSIAVVAAELQLHIPELREALALVAVVSWAVGLFLYATCAVCVVLRGVLYSFDPEDFDPTYWVAMGALAISVVAGSQIVGMQESAVIEATREVIAGVSVILWSFSVWLIPILVAIGVWRHFVRSVPLVYEPSLWSMVFPLGMFAVASMQLEQADHLPIVGTIGQSWYWLGLLAWLITTAAMLLSIGARLRKRGS